MALHGHSHLTVSFLLDAITSALKEGLSSFSAWSFRHLELILAATLILNQNTHFGGLFYYVLLFEAYLIDFWDGDAVG